MPAGGVDATSAALWAAIAVVLARTVLELLRGRNGNGGARVLTELEHIRAGVEELCRVHAPDASGVQGWKGVPELRALVETRVLPALDRIERMLEDRP